MKRFFVFFIASILLICFSGVLFASTKAQHSKALTCKITSINILQDQIASNFMASHVTLKDFRPPSKCNKSGIIIIDKKSILKAIPFKSNMELCNPYFKAAGLNKIAVDAIYNLNTAAKETIHKTYLMTLMSFLL
jgi:hypothetical protein